MPAASHPSSPATLESLRAAVAPHEGADDARAWVAFATSLPPLVVTWWLMYRALGVSYWLTLLLALPATGFVARTFIVQHDCGHGSFFRSSRLRAWVGRLCSLVTLVPYGWFRHSHGLHHATAAKLDARGADIETLTVREYLALGRGGRLRYRLTRNPAVLFGAVPLLYFVVTLRVPWLARREWPRARRSILLTDLALAAVVALVVHAVGLRAFLLVQAPITLLASTLGIWLFYVQHQFEGTYWAGAGDWDFARAALEGSSYYALPPVLAWFTGNIGYHHVHHLSPRVPSYRLAACHEGSPLLAGVRHVGLGEGFRSVRLKLWDEEAGRLVGWPGR